MRKIYQRVMAIALAITALLGVALWHLSDAPAPKKLVAQNADAGTAGVSESTLSDIRSSLEKQEYHISFDEKKKMLQSPNRAHNLRAYYQPGKFTVQTRVDTTGQGFKLELTNEGIFADGKLLYTPQSDAKANNLENKLQISHNAFTEEFINNQDGIRQNFIVESAPDGTRQLQVKMTAKGLKVRQGAGNELRFYNESGKGQIQNELVYSDLKCWDADKKPLNATLAYLDDRIQISVDVAGAAYPVTIDPIVVNGTPQNPNKVLEVNQTYMWLGFSVSSAGDVNGDGYSDIIVGAPQYDKGQDGEGAAFVYPGSASGILAGAVTLECNQADAKMGYSVASAGDFNGDGYSDVLVGIPYYNINGQHDGIAKLYYGSAQGIKDNSTPKNFATGNPGDYYGISVATAGDIDADGFSEILIGAHQLDNGQNNEGVALVYYGAGSGVPNGYKKFELLEANQANAMFGYSLAPAGDIDADGFSDIIVGARYYTNGMGQDAEGAAFIYRGSANGLLTGNPVIIEGNQYNAAMGKRVSSAGDVNGDGYSDVLISAYLFDSGIQKDNGTVSLYLGSSTGISAQQQPARTFYGNDNDHMGSSIACAGDVNGDGFSDILLGAEYHDKGQFNEGAVFVYQGSKDGIIGDPVSTLESNQIDGWFGTAIASAGDVNGDGYSDILIGCYTFDNGHKDEGHVFVYHGGADGTGTNGSITLTNNKSYSFMGQSVATAGDVNSDGYDDIIVGAPTFDKYGGSEGIAILYYGSPTGITVNDNVALYSNYANGYFGGSVAGAGDVNGDGYDDVLVGAKEYTIGQNHQGVVFLYYGGSGGLNAAGVAIGVNKADADFGFCVAGAGDVNRDGYADFIVGAPTYSANGTVFIYPGGANGVGNSVSINGTQINSYFGEAVSSAGDVNGDGYSDIIVGAWGTTLGQGGEGAAYIFEGSNGGINTVASKILEGDQSNAAFGSSVSSAGDVNGDGFCDVIVGAPNLNQDEGGAVVYYGTSSGISTTAPFAPTLLKANNSGAEFGSSVKGAGDVNGDGHSDVIVGAPFFSNGQNSEGKIFIFHGSFTGVKVLSSYSLEGDQTALSIGRSVSGAGDVNGDGYSDVLVGIPVYDNGQVVNAGATKVYYGNNGKGLRNNVRLLNAGLAGPYDHNQFIQQNFGLGLFSKSFIGRNKARLVWETRANGTAFSKVDPNPITTSTQFSGEIANLTTLQKDGAERTVILDKAGTTTRVRVRIRYSPALAITGQMYGPWRYLQRQLAGYNNAPVPEEAMAETIKRKAFTGLEGQNSITLYPNPVSDRLFIKSGSAENIQSLRLLTTGGKLLYQTQTPTCEVDVKNLDAGMYILLVTQQDGSQSSHKVIVRK